MQVRHFIIFLVFALVGNKDDLLLEEEVTYDEGLDLAKNINAIYLRTSAKNDTGEIEQLFQKIGQKLIEHFKEENPKIVRTKTKSTKIKNKSKKTKCC